jgi:hypothetical protein
LYSPPKGKSSSSKKRVGRGRVDGIPLVGLRCMGLSGYERLRERLRAMGVVLSERGGE